MTSWLLIPRKVPSLNVTSQNAIRRCSITDKIHISSYHIKPQDRLDQDTLYMKLHVVDRIMSYVTILTESAKPKPVSSS